jgi:hypothetical protein
VCSSYLTEGAFAHGSEQVEVPEVNRAIEVDFLERRDGWSEERDSEDGGDIYVCRDVLPLVYSRKRPSQGRAYAVCGRG